MIKKALLIGINQYDLPGNDLRGCVNDVNDMAGVLEGLYGFDAANINIVTDEHATKSNIITAITDFVATPDALLVLHYSGHGTQVAGANPGDPDEALCPADMLDASGVIRDKELASLFAKIPPTSRLIFISDSCHSGTVDRDLSRLRPKFMHTPGQPDFIRKERAFMRESIAIHSRHMLLSGCRDNQTSADAYIAGRNNGALTYALIQAIKSDPTRLWSDAHKDIKRWLQANGYSQVPQLSGDPALIESPMFSFPAIPGSCVDPSGEFPTTVI